jgi:energy-coupling factor transporter ATP-binding protein EcfA2
MSARRRRFVSAPADHAVMTAAIEAEGLIKRFGTTKALAGVDICADSGQVLALLGPNGAGKTTIVRILATLLRPDGGRARVRGHDVVSDATVVRQLIALTGQYASTPHLLLFRPARPARPDERSGAHPRRVVLSGQLPHGGPPARDLRRWATETLIPATRPGGHEQAR